MPEPILLSWSGGKDSALTLAALREDPRIDPVALLTSVTAGYDRVSIHGVRRDLLAAQARAVGLPLHEVWLEPASSNEAYDAAFAAAMAEMRARYPTARRVAFGDLFLEEVRRYREERLAAAGWKGLFPLWGAPTPALARAFIDRGYEARLVCVDTTLLDAAFVGRSYDARLLDDLPEGIDPCGERGEFHTFVSYGPGFDRPVAYDVGEIVIRDGRFAYCDLVVRDVAKAV
ncbi:MAG: ATP-binding protein [Gemmatimonadaceae bacterium]